MLELANIAHLYGLVFIVATLLDLIAVRLSLSRSGMPRGLAERIDALFGRLPVPRKSKEAPPTV